MKKIIKLWGILLLVFTAIIVTSCGSEDEIDSIDVISVTINDDGSTNNGSRFSAIDDKNFFLDHIKYTINEGHLVVSGYDEVGFSGIAKIVSSITYKGNKYEVWEIGEKAFRYCGDLTSVTIPNSVTSIGKYAFDYTGLTSVTIPSSVTSIGHDAFSRCIDLTSVHITDLEAWCKISFGSGGSNPLCCADYLYKNGSKITNLVIPNSVTSIGNYVFDGCRGLKSVTIPNNVTSIGIYAFAGCSGLTSITIPNSVTTIGDGAFDYCTGLTSVTIPGSVTSIGDKAFYNCKGLTSVTIPGSVTSIARYAFEGCSELTDVTCMAETVPNTDPYAFTDSYIKHATLHVPGTAIDAYKTTDPWKNFKEIVALTD